jgi:hypothetical protein
VRPRRLLGILGALFAAGPAVAQQPEELVELLIDVRVQNGPTVVIPALGGDTALYLPALGVLRITEVLVTQVLPGHRLAGVLLPSSRAFLFDTDTARLTVGDSVFPLPPSVAFWTRNDLYLLPGLLEKALDVRIVATQSELLANVLSTDHLPVVRRLTRERRRNRLEAERAAAADGGQFFRPRRSPMDGAVLDWSLTSETTDPLDNSLLRLGLGAQLLGGSGVLEHDEQFTEPGAEGRTTGSWIRAWPTNPYVRQVRLGEVQGTGRLPRFVQGAAVTNAPFLRPARFGSAPLRGVLAPGWEVELYRDRRLVSYGPVGPAGAYELDVPISYGENPVEVVGYGPYGEVVRLERTFEVAPERLPRGRFEYALAGGACPSDPCDALANLDLRFGAADWLTGIAGVDRFWRDTLPDKWHPYGGFALQPSGAVGLFAEVVADALVSGRFDFAPSPNLQATLSHTRFFGDTVAPLVGSPLDDHRTDVFAFLRPGGLSGPLFFRLDGFQVAGPTRSRAAVRAFATTRLLGTRVDAGVHYTRNRRDQEPAAAVVALEARGFHVYTGSARWLRRTLFRAEVVVEPDSGLRRVAAGIGRAFGTMVQVDLIGDWDRTVGGASLELGLTVGLPALRFFSRNRVQEGTGLMGTEQIEGSVLWDRQAARLVPADGRSLGRAGLAGIVFVDEDGDGVPGENERRLSRVRVRVGPISTETDERGRFAVWDMIPFELTEVEIDPASIRDPLIAPAVTRFTFRPDPNVFTPLPLAFVPTGEVTGRIVFGPAEEGVGSLSLELVNLDTDDRYPTISYSDGTFYVLGLRPGRYRVVVSPDDLGRLSLVAEETEFTVSRRRDEALIEGIVVRLSRAP